LAAGGSVANLPGLRDDRLLTALPRMATFEPDGLTDRQWALAEPGRHYLVYSAAGATIRLDLSATRETFQAHWIDTRTGAVNERQGIIQGGQVVDVATPGSGSCVLWLARQ